MIQPCSLFGVILPLSNHIFVQWYVSPVGGWCSTTFLHLNVSKTKEMCIGFRCNRTDISPIVINGEPVEQVDSFKYLGVVLDQKLSLFRACHSRAKEIIEPL